MAIAEIPSVVIGSGKTTFIVNGSINDSLFWDGHAYSPLISQWTNDAGYITSFTDTNESLRFGNLTATDCLGTDKVIGFYNNGTVMCGADTTGADTWQGNSSLVLNNITNWDVFYRTNASKNWTLDALNQGAYFFWDIDLGSYNATYALYNDTFNYTYASNIDTFAPNATGIFANLSINWTKKTYDEWGNWWFNQTIGLWNIFDLLSDNVTKWNAINNKISLDNNTINGILRNNASLWAEAKDKYNSTYAGNIDTFAGNQTNYSSLWNEALNKSNNSYRTIWNNTFSGTLLPTTTLLYDIGSGANRWSKLWVANISSENIDTFNLNVTNSANASIFGFGLGGYIQQAVAGIIRFFDVNVQIDRNLNVTKQANSSNSYIYGLSIDNTTKFKANLSYFGSSCIYDNGTTTIMERPCSQ